MIGNMKGEHEQKLKVHVERIVRPIRAAEKDKLKMREELFAHALDAFEYECEQGANESLAVSRAIERLGHVEATQAGLQATVGWESRYNAFCEKFVRRTQGVSLLKHACRMALLVGIFFMLYMSLLMIPIRLHELLAWNSEGQTLVRVMLGLGFLFGAATFACVVLGSFAYQLVGRKFSRRGDYLRTFGITLAMTLILGVLGWGFTYGVSFDVAVSIEIMQHWLVMSLAVTACLFVAAWCDVRERVKCNDWLELDLSD